MKYWYELQEFNDEWGWFNWRDDGLVYDCIGDALADYYETNGVKQLPDNARIVECRAVMRGGM